MCVIKLAIRRAHLNRLELSVLRRLDGRHCLGLATSPDGISWAVANGGAPILEPVEAWEGQQVGSPRMVEMGDGTVRLYYTGTATDGKSSIGAAVAKASDLTKWTRL